MRRRFLTLLTATLVAGGFSAALADQHPVPPSAIANMPLDKQTCRGCHKEATPKVYKEWARSRHSIANVRCFQCHGTLQDFHKTPPLTKCLACHSEQIETAKKRAPGVKCWQCHIPHVFMLHGNGYKTKTAKDLGANK